MGDLKKWGGIKHSSDFSAHCLHISKLCKDHESIYEMRRQQVFDQNVDRLNINFVCLHNLHEQCGR